MTFDSNNDLWMSFCDGEESTGYLAEISAAALRHLITTGGGKFTTIIEDPSTSSSVEYLTCPGGLLFDTSGNLWVETAGGSATSALPALLEYTSEELTPGKHLFQSPPAAAVIKTPSIQTGLGPTLAFDKDGNLWQSGGVISTDDPSAEQETVAEYTVAQLEAGTQTDPNQTLIVADTSVTGALNAPSSLTFDANGNLWVAFALGGSNNTGGVQMFAASDLEGTGNTTPAAAVTLGPAPFPWGKVTLQSIADPGGLAFDSAGNLWIANQSRLNAKLGLGSLVEYTALELAAIGNPVPVNLGPVRAILAAKNESNLGAPIYLTFGPALP
jgi:secreted PhoX family phosphatase